MTTKHPASAATTQLVPPASEPWWKSAVVYQIYPRSFADSDGDGIGDLNGIISRLDHLEKLGVDVVWLSPVYNSPQADNGYDISDYQGIDPTYGTMHDLDRLIRELHGRGMKLVMDLVVNHTSDEHPWFVDSSSSAASPRRDWYWWRPARDGHVGGEPGAEPNNWGSFFSGSAWQLDDRTGEYFLHLFSGKQPDLNWENPELRQAIYSMMRWWLDRGVDGFRMDVVNLISKEVELPDGPVAPGAAYGDGSAGYITGPKVHDYLQEMHAAVFAGRQDLLTVGEMPGVTPEDALRFTDPARRELDMVFQFEHVELDHGNGKFDVQPFDLRALKRSLGRWQQALASKGWNSLYWNNHDQPRAVSRFGNDGDYRVESATLLGTILHLHRGTPFIYQGEELGMANPGFTTVDQLRDIESINHHAAAVLTGQDSADVLAGIARTGRDNARTPMQWDDGPQAGFTTGIPWIEVNPDHDRVNAAAQVGVAGSVFEHYRRLIDLRHREPVVAHGDFTMLLPDHPTIYAFTRTYDATALLVLGNFSEKAVPLSIPDADIWLDSELLLGNLPPDGLDAAVLRPWEARVLRRRMDVPPHHEPAPAIPSGA